MDVPVGDNQKTAVDCAPAQKCSCGWWYVYDRIDLTRAEGLRIIEYIENGTLEKL